MDIHSLYTLNLSLDRKPIPLFSARLGKHFSNNTLQRTLREIKVELNDDTQKHGTVSCLDGRMCAVGGLEASMPSSLLPSIREETGVQRGEGSCLAHTVSH